MYNADFKRRKGLRKKNFEGLKEKKDVRRGKRTRTHRKNGHGIERFFKKAKKGYGKLFCRAATFRARVGKREIMELEKILREARGGRSDSDDGKQRNEARKSGTATRTQRKSAFVKARNKADKFC